jgi:hypothetical protein
MRHLAWLAVVAAGCGGGMKVPNDPDEPVRSDGRVDVDPAAYQNVRTSELGTDRTRGIAKTIEWQKSGTELGTTYCGGAVVVEKILRDDADNFYGVRVRLANRQNQAAAFQWRIQFTNLKGEPLIGFNHNEVDEPVWKSVSLAPLGMEVVTDSCRLKGAVAFRLFVRKAGGKEDGLPDGFGKRS